MIKIDPSIKNPWEYVMKTTKKQSLWLHANKLTMIALGQKIAEKFLGLFHIEYRVSEKKLQRVMAEIKSGSAYKEYLWIRLTGDYPGLAEFRGKLYSLLEHNAALTEFMLIAEAANSRTFIPWVFNVMIDGDYARAMMVAVGEGVGFNGEPQQILEDDSFARGVAWGWTMGEAVWRQMKARTLMLTHHHVAILGAGYLPELSPVYGDNLPIGLTVIACDTNPDIDPGQIEAKYPFVHYKKMAALPFLKCTADAQFDAVIMPGVMSYNMNDFMQLIYNAVRVLRSGGVFLFDMQVLHPELVAVKLTYHWGENMSTRGNGIKLMTAKKTISMVQNACLDLQDRYHYALSFGYSHSGHYKTTSALTFEITKIQLTE